MKSGAVQRYACQGQPGVTHDKCAIKKGRLLPTSPFSVLPVERDLVVVATCQRTLFTLTTLGYQLVKAFIVEVSHSNPGV